MEFENLDFSKENNSVSFSDGHIFSMEEDCKENVSNIKPSCNEVDTSQLFTNLSSHITTQVHSIQDQIVKNNQNISQDFQRVGQENEIFKVDIWAELDGIRTLLGQHQISSNPDSVQSSISASNLSPPVVMSSSVTTPVIASLSPSIAPASSSNFQTQMMQLFTDSFTKLSTVLADKKEDTKMEWPKFSGDPKKFRSWHLAILTQISLPPWKELYDPTCRDIVSSTSNLSLNEKFYAKLLLALDGPAFQNIVNREHLRADGLLLLQDLVDTYRPKNVPEVIAAKTTLFWGNTKRLPSESIDDYYNRFCELLYEINGDVERIPLKDAMRHFIFTLGSEFETIQNNFRIDNQPTKWYTKEWSTLLILCRDYYNSVRPQGLIQTPSTMSCYIDHTAHRKKVKNWFMNPVKFKKKIEAEQAKHPNKCIFHLSKTHPTETCQVKKECDALLSAQKSASASSTSTTSSGRLHHITEETYEDSLTEDDVVDTVTEHEDNDTKEDELIYFANLTNHYL